MRLVRLGWLVFLGSSLLNSLASQECASCQQVPESHAVVDDICTTVLVTWLGSAPGSCKFNPAPKCVANENCRFSIRVEIFDHGCGFLYGQTYCTQHVDTNGTPIGLAACTVESFYFPNPSIVMNYPVACGKKDSWIFRRHFAGLAPQIIASPSGTCKACPAQVYDREEG